MKVGSNQKEILAVVMEIKNYILDLKRELLPFLCSQKDITEPKSPLKKNHLVILFSFMLLGIFHYFLLNFYSHIVCLSN